MSGTPLLIRCSPAGSPLHANLEYFSPPSLSSEPHHTSLFATTSLRAYDACSLARRQVTPVITAVGARGKKVPAAPTHVFSLRHARSNAVKPQLSSQFAMPNLRSIFGQPTSARPWRNNTNEAKREEAFDDVSWSKKNSMEDLARDSSVKSLTAYDVTKSPEPLLRRCQTVIELNDSEKGSSTSTKVVVKQKKASRLNFFRRMKPSRSAVFANTKGSSIMKSRSTISGFQVIRNDPNMMQTQPEEAYVSGGCSRCASYGSLISGRFSVSSLDKIHCKLCLSEVSIKEIYELEQCSCCFCRSCMASYTAHRIREGNAAIECPDASCDCKGELSPEEVEGLVGKDLFGLYCKFKNDREVALDPFRTWCPSPGCETVVLLSSSKLSGVPQDATCPSCASVFCSSCNEAWHPRQPCLAPARTDAEKLNIPLNEIIKRCPRCKVPIERDDGCAQMQCKKCKHVFCWYCLASLEDDFLLRHYDKGPCKNKLGHSRASVLWHRIQVIGIFAGFGLMLVMASPILLFVGPCLLCCKCRHGARSAKSAEEDSLYGP